MADKKLRHGQLVNVESTAEYSACKTNHQGPAFHP